MAESRVMIEVFKHGYWNAVTGFPIGSIFHDWIDAPLAPDSRTQILARQL